MAAREGDRVAESELLTRFEPLVRSLAQRLVADALVDDVVQETYLAASAALPRLRTPEAFPAWLRLIVRKQASRLRPRAAEVSLQASAEQDAPGADPAEHAERNDVIAIVRSALAAASDRDRRLLELRHVAGWSIEQIAELLAISPGAVRKRLHDARRRLRPVLAHLNPKEQAVTNYRAYLGAVHTADLDVPTGAPSLQAPDPNPTTTGLKVIDTMAPVRRGGTIEMTGPAGTGQVVVLFELLYRLGRTEDGTACVAVGRSGAAIGSQPDLSHIVTEAGIPGPNAAILVDTPADTERAFQAAARLAAGLAHEGLDVILAVDQPSLRQLTTAQVAASAGLGPDGSVTVVALNIHDRGANATAPLGLDTTLVFSVEHLALGIFPAVDGVRSSSTLDLTDTARTAKNQLANAADLRNWFNQPLYVAQDFTGDDGTWCEPADAEAELSALTA